MQDNFFSVDDQQLLQRSLKTARTASRQTRFLHRAHCVALVASGMACADVAQVLGGDPRSVQRWVQTYKASGLQGLEEALRPGRPPALPIGALQELQMALKNSPQMLDHPADAWSSSVLQAEIARRFAIRLSTRHCQRLLAKFADSASSA